MRECLIHMPVIDMGMINRSDLFQLSVSAEIHTFPCFSRVVAQAQETEFCLSQAVHDKTVLFEFHNIVFTGMVECTMLFMDNDSWMCPDKVLQVSEELETWFALFSSYVFPEDYDIGLYCQLFFSFLFLSFFFSFYFFFLSIHHLFTIA